jgi:hypothetical protein
MVSPRVRGDFIPAQKTAPDATLDFISEPPAKRFTAARWLPDGGQIANSQPIYSRRQPGHLHIQKSSKPAV